MIKILSISDNSDNFVVLNTLLTTSFPDVVFSSSRSGKTGIQQARSTEPDLILIDLELPDMDGFDTCRLLREDTLLQKVSVIILTTEKPDTSNRSNALHAGADAFLSIPLNENELIAIVSTMRRIKQSEVQVTQERKKLELTFEERTKRLQVQLDDFKRTDLELKKSYHDLEMTKLATLNLMEDLKAEVDQRKRSEETLKESQQKFMDLSIMFRSISDNMTDMLWAKDLEKKFIFTNKSVCDNLLLATDTEEPIGKGDLYFASRQRELHTNDPVWHTFGELCIDSDQVVMDSGKPEQFDEYGNIKGQFIFLDVRKSPLYDTKGKMIGTVGSAQDITSEREMSKQLAQSERQLSTLVSNLPGMVYRCMNDRAWSMLFVSDGSQSLTGYTSEDFIDNHKVLFNDIIIEEYREIVWNEWQVALANGDMYEGEYPIITSTGEKKWVWERGRGIYNDQGEVLYLEGYIEDISGRRIAEEALKKLNSELEQRVLDRTAQLEASNQRLEASNKELEAFSYSVSHDLRAPLRAIDGFTRILFEDYLPMFDEEGRRVCAVIKENAVRMGQLIDDLLSLSRLNRTDMQIDRINMANLSKIVYGEITSAEEKKRTEFEMINVHPAFGDHILVRQVLVNLLGNAVKFTSQREMAKVSLSSEKQGDMVVFCVSDNGAGFDMKYVDKLFGAFQRLHSVKEFDGTGIGLAIVQRIIHRHGGKVWAKGTVGQGASFYFSLPLKTGEQGMITQKDLQIKKNETI
ncbi:MAG: ATP-binding protein [Bacteroidota bacterium]